MSKDSCSSPLSVFRDKGPGVMAAPSPDFIRVQFVAHSSEPLLAVAQSIPIKTKFLQKTNADLVSPKYVKELMFFGFTDTGRQAPKLKQSTA